MLLKSIKACQAEDILINSATLVSFAQQAEYATDHVSPRSSATAGLSHGNFVEGISKLAPKTDSRFDGLGICSGGPLTF
jgi:hypothetical protein